MKYLDSSTLDKNSNNLKQFLQESKELLDASYITSSVDWVPIKEGELLVVVDPCFYIPYKKEDTYYRALILECLDIKKEFDNKASMRSILDTVLNLLLTDTLSLDIFYISVATPCLEQVLLEDERVWHKNNPNYSVDEGRKSYYCLLT